MKINKLVLHNFGIYANINTLDFTSNKPVILVGGMNGRGKTTLLEAILLALYGRRSFAFIESKLSFPSYLTALVNKADGSLKTYIELIFEMPSGEEIDCYSARREWSLHNIAPSLKTVVHKNGAYDQILSTNWDLFVEEMLPSAIAPFFFFDGEKISELANSDNDTHMKNSIKSLLGIDIIEQAMTDIRKIVSNKKYTIKANSFAKEISVFEENLRTAEIEAKKAQETAGSLEIKQRRLFNKLQESENAFAALGGNFALSRKELLVKQSVLKERLSDVNAKILEIVSGDLPLLMVLPLLKDVLCVAESEKEQKAIHAALEQLPALYKDFNKEKGQSLDFNEFIDYLKDTVKETETIYDLTENGIFLLKSLCIKLPTSLRDDVIHILKQRQTLLSEISEIENYLSINVDELAIGNKYNEIIAITAEHATVSEQYRLAQENADLKHSIFEGLQRQQQKIIEKAVGSLEDADDTKRIITYAGYSMEVLSAYKTRLQEAKTQSLAATMTKCFKQIASKQNLISEIQINAQSLDFVYLDSDGNPTNRTSFSAGEKQLLVIAMLWALGICSKKKFPVIIDTPLARLDNAHRETLIKNYFPKASDQTILLSTDTEVYGKYYDLIRTYVDKEFTLAYNDEAKQTVIQDGYFEGEAI
jgi:DNA sulfur modification protein DndD